MSAYFYVARKNLINPEWDKNAQKEVDKQKNMEFGFVSEDMNGSMGA